MEKHFSKWVWLSFLLFMVLHKKFILFIFGKWITRKEKCQKYFERHRICVFPFFIYNIPKRHTDHEFFFPQTTVFLIAFQFFKCIYISNEMLSQNHQSLMWSVANHWDDMEKCELSTFFLHIRCDYCILCHCFIRTKWNMMENLFRLDFCMCANKKSHKHLWMHFPRCSVGCSNLTQIANMWHIFHHCNELWWSLFRVSEKKSYKKNHWTQIRR